jgi:hypothetical protein
MSVGLEPVMSSCRDKSVFKGGGGSKIGTCHFLWRQQSTASNFKS